MPEDRCILCDGSAPFASLFERGRFRLVRCEGCGLVFQSPQPDQSVLEASYYDDPAFTDALFGPFREYTLELAREKLRRLRAAGALRPGLRLLDVGCSSGAWLEVAEEAGVRGVGVELGVETAARARARGLDVRQGTLAEAHEELRDERFDLVTFWDVLEHLRDPRRELDLAASLLADGGRVAATFPNVAGWYPRLTYRLFSRRTGTWEHPELPVHLYDFAPATARRLFEQQGLAPEVIRTFPLPFRYYRETTLSRRRLAEGWRGVALRLAYEGLHAVVYPAARAFDRSNSLFVVARRADRSRQSLRSRT